MKSKLQYITTVLKSKLFWGLFASIFVVNYAYDKAPVRIDYTFDNCLPWSYWVTYKEFDPNIHKYILFVPKKDKYTQKANYLLKQVGCKPTQYLETRGLDYYCDGVKISTAKKFDLSGKPLEQFIFQGYIDKDKYFAIASHPYAYDSKYFGFVNKSQIERGAKPLEFN